MKKLSRVEKKMRRRRCFFRFLLLILFMSSMIVFALNTKFFVIDNIKVLGNDKLSKDTIISGSSINIGQNIFKINKKSGEEALKKMSYIKEVKIKRKLPKKIIIEVTERKEIAQIKRISSMLLIDTEGYILNIVDTESEKLPLFNGLNIDNINIGENIFLTEETEEKLEFIREGHNIFLLSKMKEIDMADNNNVNIVLIDGISVAFGTLDNVKYKLNLLNEVLKDIEKNQISCKMILMNKGDNPIIVVNEE